MLFHTQKLLQLTNQDWRRWIRIIPNIFIYKKALVEHVQQLEESRDTARDLWEKKDYRAAVQLALRQCEADVTGSLSRLTQIFMDLAYGLISSSEIDLFNEQQKLFVRYMQLINIAPHEEPPIGYHNQAALMQHNLRAVLFRLYDGQANISDVLIASKQLEFWTARVSNLDKFNEINLKLQKLVSLLQEGKHPYFTVSYRLPFSIAVPDGSYPISGFGNVQSVEISCLKIEELSSAINDRFFSKIKLTIRGFTSTNNYWLGPNLVPEDMPPNAVLSLKIVNHILLCTKLVDEHLRLRTVSYQDLGRHDIRQFDGANDSLHMAFAFGFGGDALVDVQSKQELDQAGLDCFMEMLRFGKLTLHDEIFAEALIQQSNANWPGAFYLINSACESMIARYLFQICEQRNLIPEYNAFIVGRSFCLNCELYKSKTIDIEPPQAVMGPSLFSQLKFLKDIDAATPKQLKAMRGALSDLRNDSLRNDLVHGRIKDIPASAVTKAISAYKLIFAELVTIRGSADD